MNYINLLINLRKIIDIYKLYYDIQSVYLQNTFINFIKKSIV